MIVHHDARQDNNVCASDFCAGVCVPGSCSRNDDCNVGGGDFFCNSIGICTPQLPDGAPCGGVSPPVTRTGRHRRLTCAVNTICPQSPRVTPSLCAYSQPAPSVWPKARFFAERPMRTQLLLRLLQPSGSYPLLPTIPGDDGCFPGAHVATDPC